MLRSIDNSDIEDILETLTGIDFWEEERGSESDDVVTFAAPLHKAHYRATITKGSLSFSIEFDKVSGRSNKRA